MVETPYQIYAKTNLYLLTEARPASAPCSPSLNNQSQPIPTPQPGIQPNNMGGAMQGFPSNCFPVFAIPYAMIYPFPSGGGFPQMPGSVQQPQSQQPFSAVPSQISHGFEHLTCGPTCPGYIPREAVPFETLCQRYTCPVFLPISTAPSGDTIKEGDATEATPEELSVSVNISMDEDSTVPATKSKSHI